MTMNTVGFRERMATIEERVENLQHMIAEIREEQKEMSAIIHEWRGNYKWILVIFTGGISAALYGIVEWFRGHLH